MFLDVFVNGKRITADVTDINIEEGWVEIEDPSILNESTTELGKPGDVLLTSNISLPRKKLFGTVTVRVSPDAEN